jgi:hypothetical protein
MSRIIILIHICVSAERNVTNRVGEILGFGETMEGNAKMPCTLQRAYIQIFTISQCNESELPLYTSNPRVLCAGVIGGGVDSCQVSKTTQIIMWCSYSCHRNILYFYGTSKYIAVFIKHATGKYSKEAELNRNSIPDGSILWPFLSR